MEQDKEVELSILKIWINKVCCISSIFSARLAGGSLDAGEGCAGAPRHPTGISKLKGT